MCVDADAVQGLGYAGTSQTLPGKPFLKGYLSIIIVSPLLLTLYCISCITDMGSILGDCNSLLGILNDFMMV